MGNYLFDPAKTQFNTLRIRLNELETVDSWVQTGLSFIDAKTIEFWDIFFETKMVTNIMYYMNVVPFYNWNVMMLEDSKRSYGRRAYGILDVMGDYGGAKGTLDEMAIFLLASAASHAFLGYAISKLYYAHTENHSVFESTMADPSDRNIRHIKIGLKHSCQKYLSNLFSCYKSGDPRVKRLYDKGGPKVEEEMDIVHIIKSIRHM